MAKALWLVLTKKTFMAEFLNVTKCSELSKSQAVKSVVDFDSTAGKVGAKYLRKALKGVLDGVSPLLNKSEIEKIEVLLKDYADFAIFSLRNFPKQI